MKNIMTYSNFVTSVLTFKERHSAKPEPEAEGDLPEQRPTRCAASTDGLSDEWLQALESLDLSHIDPELDKLMN